MDGGWRRHPRHVAQFVFVSQTSCGEAAVVIRVTIGEWCYYLPKLASRFVLSCSIEARVVRYHRLMLYLVVALLRDMALFPR